MVTSATTRVFFDDFTSSSFSRTRMANTLARSPESLCVQNTFPALLEFSFDFTRPDASRMFRSSIGEYFCCNASTFASFWRKTTEKKRTTLRNHQKGTTTLKNRSRLDCFTARTSSLTFSLSPSLFLMFLLLLLLLSFSDIFF